MNRGHFITLEGGEGAGKSTLARALSQRLREGGASVVTTREPGGSPKAEAIREAILAGRIKSFGPFAEALMFSAARIDHIDRLIKPALAEGNWVICDRFIDSTRVYQGVLGQIDPGLLAELEQATIDGLMPELTLILDLPASEGVERAQSRGTLSRYDAERIETHEILRKGFLEIATHEPKRCVLIDASLPVSSVETAVWQAVSAHLLVEAR